LVYPPFIVFILVFVLVLLWQDFELFLLGFKRNRSGKKWLNLVVHKTFVAVTRIGHHTTTFTNRAVTAVAKNPISVGCFFHHDKLNPADYACGSFDCSGKLTTAFGAVFDF
jgi:hypothetical protein